MKKPVIIMAIVILCFIILCVFSLVDVYAESVLDTGSPYEPFLVEATAYNNPNGNKTSEGKDTIEGITIAAKPEWAGCVVALYFVDPETGGLGKFFGYREVTDTGYGHPSTLYFGKGTIETGETVDVYFDDYETAKNWGSKTVYIQVIPGKG